MSNLLTSPICLNQPINKYNNNNNKGKMQALLCQGGNSIYHIYIYKYIYIFFFPATTTDPSSLLA